MSDDEFKRFAAKVTPATATELLRELIRYCGHCSPPDLTKRVHNLLFNSPATASEPKNPCDHVYSRSINQPYPRHCIKCDEIEGTPDSKPDSASTGKDEPWRTLDEIVGYLEDQWGSANDPDPYAASLVINARQLLTIHAATPSGGASTDKHDEDSPWSDLWNFFVTNHGLHLLDSEQFDILYAVLEYLDATDWHDAIERGFLKPTAATPSGGAKWDYRPRPCDSPRGGSWGDVYEGDLFIASMTENTARSVIGRHNATLQPRDDKKRLDWLLSPAGRTWIYWRGERKPPRIVNREAIDAAMKVKE